VTCVLLLSNANMAQQATFPWFPHCSIISFSVSLLLIWLETLTLVDEGILFLQEQGEGVWDSGGERS
jgi:hypothetical protein